MLEVVSFNPTLPLYFPSSLLTEKVDIMLHNPSHFFLAFGSSAAANQYLRRHYLSKCQHFLHERTGLMNMRFGNIFKDHGFLLKPGHRKFR